MVERDGLAGLTHRAVAAEAGVPLASASYHFAGIDDLAQAALRRANDALVEAVAADGRPASPEGLAELLAEDVARHPGRLVAEYELYLLALRRPELRPEALAWLDVVADRYAPGLRGPARRAFRRSSRACACTPCSARRRPTWMRSPRRCGRAGRATAADGGPAARTGGPPWASGVPLPCRAAHAACGRASARVGAPIGKAVGM